MAKIIFLVAFICTGIGVVYYMNQPKEKPLPIINPVDLIEENVVDEELLRVGMGHTIGSFSFKNQENKTITDKDVRGKVFVAEYFFTTCGTICPAMNKNMQLVQLAFADEKQFKILSFTVDPEVDVVDKMKTYATDHKANSRQWWFLTGKKEELYSLARKSFFLLKPAEAQNIGDVGSDFIHTNNFVLVDKQMRIRGYYDGTSKEEVGELIEGVKKLLKEK